MSGFCLAVAAPYIVHTTTNKNLPQVTGCVSEGYVIKFEVSWYLHILGGLCQMVELSEGGSVINRLPTLVYNCKLPQV